MKSIKKILITTLLVVFIISLSDIPAFCNPVTAQAAAVKISKKSLTLEVGQNAALKITGAKKAVTWSSSDKTIATVSNKGKVTAIAVGTAKITAKVSSAKYTCTVTVTEPANPYLKDAPFKAQEVNIQGVLDLVIPADWTLNYNLTSTGVTASITPNDTSVKSAIVIGIQPSTISDYSEIKDKFTAQYTQDYLTQAYTKSMNGKEFTITDLSQTDLTTSNGSVLKTQFTLNVDNTPLVQQIYDFNMKTFLFEIEALNDNGTDLSTIIEYAINSLIIK